MKLLQMNRSDSKEFENYLPEDGDRQQQEENLKELWEELKAWPPGPKFRKILYKQKDINL